jgi:hypothetical protein
VHYLRGSVFRELRTRPRSAESQFICLNLPQMLFRVIGVCCRFIAQCGSIIYHNGTSFQSQGYPSKFNPTDGSNVCQVRIKRPLNSCQLRLNFIALEIDGPTTPPTTAAGTIPNDAGTCKTDSFSITLAL